MLSIDGSYARFENRELLRGLCDGSNHVDGSLMSSMSHVSM